MNIDKLDAKRVHMTTAPVESLVLRMAVPTIIIMLISAMYNTADSYFVGKLGTSATAAVGIAFPLMAVIQAVGFFFGHGSGNFISRELGAGHIDRATRMASVGFFFAFLIGCFITVAGLLFVDQLAVMLGSTVTILPHAREYLFYILLGAPWITASFTINNLLRFQGNAFYGMLGMAAGAILNVVLDPIFIFSVGLGVAGAAIATLISQIVGFSLLLVGSCKSGSVRPHLLEFKPRLADYKEIVRGGFPSLARQGLASIAVIFLNNVSAPHGDAVIAAMSIVQRVSLIAGSALIGSGQGFQPVCGFNYGAGLYDRVLRALRFCVVTSFFFLLVLSAGAYVFAPDIIAIFRHDDPDVIRIGALALRLSCLALPLVSWVIMNNMMLQTIGRAVRASILATARQGLFFMPILFALAPRYGVWGIQVSQPLADLATFLLSIPLGLGVIREMQAGKPAGKCEVSEEVMDEWV